MAHSAFCIATSDGQAIEIAFKRAERGDTVLLAGKGTEQSIVIGNTHWPWDERRIVREVLQDLR